MTDLVEDVQVVLQWTIDYLTVVLNTLRDRIRKNKHRPINRKTLIRWVATLLPFKTRDPRMFIKHQLGASPKKGVGGLQRLPSTDSLHSSFTSANVHQWLEENIGQDMIHYRRASVSTDDDELDDLRLAQVAAPMLLTSTPNHNISAIDDSVSIVSSNQGSSIRLLEMEDELAALRRQIAQLVVAQESNSNNKTITDNQVIEARSDMSIAAKMPLPLSPSHLDDSGCESETIRGPSPDLALIPPAPPPPPPPPVPPKPDFKMPLCSDSAFSTILQERKSSLSSMKDDERQSRSSAPDLVNVLRDLGSVKLRATDRSPGGTPFRREPRKPLANDPASIIALALKKKFAAHRGRSPDSDQENDSSFYSDSSPIHVKGKKINRRLSLFHDDHDDQTPVASPLKT